MERCNGKLKYDKKGAATVRNARQQEGERALRSYHCDKCNGWHLTHKTKRR